MESTVTSRPTTRDRIVQAIITAHHDREQSLTHGDRIAANHRLDAACRDLAKRKKQNDEIRAPETASL